MTESSPQHDEILVSLIQEGWRDATDRRRM
jgi:hypothetical protein